MGRSNEITRAKEEAEHWKLACLVLRNHNNELMMECSQVKKRLEEGFKKGTEISQKNVVVYKRKRDTDVLEDEQRDKCQQCVKLNWEIDDLKYEIERASGEIEGLKTECMELEVQGDLNNMSCNQLKAKIAILEAETSEREKIQQERITCLEKEYKETECSQKDRCIQLSREIEDMKLGKKRQADEIKDLKRKCVQMERRVTVSSNHETKLAKELEAHKTKCQGLSVEMEQKGLALENLQEVNGALDLEREHYMTKCSGLEEKIEGLMEIGAVIYEREVSARERICHLEAVVKKMESDQDAYKIKCQGLSAELKQKGVELEDLREVNGALDREREHYRTKCSGMEEHIKGLIEEGVVMSEREMSAGERICHLEAVVKKMEIDQDAYKIKCQGLSAEIKRKGVELEGLREVNGALHREGERYTTKCSGLEEQIKGLIEEGAVMAEREMSGRERICHLEETIKKMEIDQDAYRIKCQGLSAELKRKGVELEDLREVNGAFDREREHFRTKCSGLEEQIKGLIEGGAVMAEREKSAGGRICHLEETIKKMETDQNERCKELETRLSKVEEENSALRGLQNRVSREKTCRQMDGSVDVAHLTRTETSPSSSFALSCKPPTLQVDFDGVPASDLALVNNLCKFAEGGKDYFASASGHQVCFETQGRLTRFRKCSGTPSTENLAFVRQQDGARPSTTSPTVVVDRENEIVYISDSEG